MNDTDLAYAAGIMDGEGSIGIYANRSKRGYRIYTLRVRVTNTDEWLPHWLKENFGGCVGVQLQPEDENWKPAWYWTIGCRSALAFLELVLPYLRLKKPQAEIAIKFQKARPWPRTGRHFTEGERAVMEAERNLIQGLNRRGLQ